MDVLDRVNARARRVRGERRSSIDEWISDYLIPAAGQFTYGGFTYPYGGLGGGLQQTLAGNRVAEIASTLPGYAQALRQCPPAFAAELVRASVLSQVRFTFRNPPWNRATPRRQFTNADLGVLERPWVNGTTGDLVSRMEWHAGLAGNAFVYRQPARLRVLRPDWTAIIYGSQSEPEWPSGALDAELIGYIYSNRGIGSGDPHFLLPRDVAHWAPLPDPELTGLGMSWLTPAIRAMQLDRLATQHQVRFFEHGATPNLVIKGIPAVSKEQFDDLVDKMEERHAGVANAYRTLYLTAGADATVIGSNLRDLDLESVQDSGETRLSQLSRVPAALLGIKAGLQGSSLNAGNFSASRRLFADSWVYPSLQNLAASLAPVMKVPADGELWFDTTDMPVLREDAKDAADIAQVKAVTITTLVKDGFSPESAIAAVEGQDMTRLQHTGLVSVQLQPPRTELQKAQTVQLEALAAELMVRAGYTTESARDAVTGLDLSKLQPGPLTSRYLIVNPLEAGAEPGVPAGFPNAEALGLPQTVPILPDEVPDTEETPPAPPAQPGFSADAQAADEPGGT